MLVGCSTMAPCPPLVKGWPIRCSFLCLMDAKCLEPIHCKDSRRESISLRMLETASVLYFLNYNNLLFHRFYQLPHRIPINSIFLFNLVTYYVHKSLLSAYYVLSTVLTTGDTVVKKIGQIPNLMELTFWWESQTINKMRGVHGVFVGNGCNGKQGWLQAWLNLAASGIPAYKSWKGDRECLRVLPPSPDKEI